jgi:acetyl esterase/lipase
MRDYGLLYEKVLRNEGMRTKVDFYPGLPHGFWAIAPQAEFTKAWKRDMKMGFSWLLGQSGD